MRPSTALTVLLVAAVLATGCATAPKTQAEKQSLVAESDAAVATMTAKDPSLREFINRGHGYAVFPDVGKAGAIVGGGTAAAWCSNGAGRSDSRN